MTDEQKPLARHALGLDGRHKVSYRNHFVVGPGCKDYEEWCAMVAAGEAKHKGGSAISGGDDIFWMTNTGASLALNKGESLDTEDFPRV